MPSITQTAYAVKTRKTALRKAVECIALSDGLAAVGEDFPYKHWNGQRYVECTLRYDIVVTDDGFEVVSTRTMPVMYMECRGCGEVFEQTEGSEPPIPEALAHQARGTDCHRSGFRRNLTEDEAF